MNRIANKSTVTVCGHDYQFVRSDDLRNAEGVPIHGLCQTHYRRMVVQNGHIDEYDAHVTLHEITHAILEHSGVGELLTAEVNEAVANAVSYGLLSVRVNGKPLIK